MELDLIGILNNNGASLKVDGTVSFENMEFSGTEYKFSAPLSIQGKIANVSGVLEFTAHVTGAANTFCDRCAKPIDIEINYDFNETLVQAGTEVEDADDVLILDETVINVDDIALNNFLTNCSLQHLCKPDCKGLCQVCGADKNTENCSCEENAVDPRLDVLNNLFKD